MRQALRFAFRPVAEAKSAAALAAAAGAAGAASSALSGSSTSACEEAKYVPPQVWQPVVSGGKFAGVNRPTAGARTQQALSVGKHPIQLYSLGTPNGVKVTIMLEEICAVYTDFDYDAWRIKLDGAQFTSGFVEANPNSKIPAMMDHTTSPPTRVFESGAILIYLAEKYPDCKLLPTGTAKRAECLSWLMWQMGSAPFVGGGFGHFYFYAPERLEYPINRYAMETKRQLDVLNQQLAKNTYICGEEYTIADIAIWPWYGGLVLRRLYGAGDFLSVDEYTHVVRWAKQVEQRLAVRRGRMVNRNDPDKSDLYAGIPALLERHGRQDWAN
uniref:Glutathione transferase n=1 Tax=Zooxanthella nutricula TaxID=1333877 RepID=A0A7S2ICH0_9DINO